MNINDASINNKTAENLLNSKKAEANEILNDKDKFDQFMERLERKLTAIPKIGTKLSEIPTLVEMLKMWGKKTYNKLPTGTILTILAALIYFVAPIDLICDAIPLAGYLDDIAVLGVCSKYLVADDIREFKEWRKKTFSEEEEG